MFLHAGAVRESTASIPTPEMLARVGGESLTTRRPGLSPTCSDPIRVHACVSVVEGHQNVTWACSTERSLNISSFFTTCHHDRGQSHSSGPKKTIVKAAHRGPNVESSTGAPHWCCALYRFAFLRYCMEKGMVLPAKVDHSRGMHASMWHAYS